MLLKSFEMDARRSGMREGIVQGRSEGIEQGSYQKALDTAKLMKSMNYPINDICTISGLSLDEIEKL